MVLLRGGTNQLSSSGVRNAQRGPAACHNLARGSCGALCPPLLLSISSFVACRNLFGSMMGGGGGNLVGTLGPTLGNLTELEYL
jgi:hypothetical protein